MSRRHLPLLGYLVLAASMAAAFYFGTPGSARKIHAEIRARCLESQVNRAALRAIIMRGRDVGKSGSPGYSYYKAHPGEARQARKRVDQALVELPPIDC